MLNLLYCNVQYLNSVYLLLVYRMFAFVYMKEIRVHLEKFFAKIGISIKCFDQVTGVYFRHTKIETS